MALTRAEAQVTWSSAQYLTIADTNAHDSDAVTFGATVHGASLTVYADNQGTAASGDTVKIQIKWTTGDILGDTGDDYDTTEHAAVLGVLDTYASNTPGEDPVCKTWDIPVSAKGFKVCITCAQGGTRSIKVYARLATMLAA